ncbi:hypothetical protein MMC12_004073 [Toensbergia leucococca]|nr:hypothetical protein [Toensbergia leucococca]
MAKSKNSSQHNQSKKAHRNGSVSAPSKNPPLPSHDIWLRENSLLMLRMGRTVSKNQRRIATLLSTAPILNSEEIIDMLCTGR